MRPLSPAEREYLAGLLDSYVDYPKPGVKFLDITPLLAEPAAFSLAVDAMCAPLSDLDFDGVLAIEARGLIVGSAIAHRLRKGFVMVRKGGKLPGRPDSFSWQSEYDAGVFEVPRGLVRRGKKYVVVDDVLAIGGVSSATAAYTESVGGIVAGYSFLIEISGLAGRERLDGAPVFSVLQI